MTDESVEDSPEETSETTEVFIGPSQANWYKFQLARIGMFLSTHIPYFTKTRFGNWVFNKSFEVTMFSRDFDIKNESSPQNPEDQD